MHDEVGVKIVGKGLGNVTEDDIAKAEASQATIVGFNVKPTPLADQLMREKDIHFLPYSIIYDLINWVKTELEKMLSKEVIVTELGRMKVVAIFRKEKSMMIVGGRVEDGKVVKGSLARVRREDVVMGTGKIVLCKVGQTETKEVTKGTECGVQFEGKTRIEINDVLEIYSEEVKVKKIIFK
jgi:translation initiation factor IF-2